MLNKESYNIKGMLQDSLIGTGISNKFAFEIKNMRVYTTDDYTTLSWTNERSTKAVSVRWVLTDDYPSEFTPLGQAVIKGIWILFCKQTYRAHGTDFIKEDKDIIIKLYYKKDELKGDVLWGDVLYSGDLGFDLKHPIETHICYESEVIQKVYWTDGINQPRMINIARVGDDNRYYLKEGNNTQFDFVQEVDLNEEVTVSKLKGYNGLFTGGTVKYAITYFNKYGQESNIVYDSPLYYPITGERGVNPDGKETSGDSFEITVTNIDRHLNFDYLRIYSIQRATEGSTPIVKVVADIKLPEGRDDDISIKYIDTNTTGYIIDPSILLYLGGREILAYTMDSKDNTLFLGNIELKRNALSSTLKESIRNAQIITEGSNGNTTEGGTGNDTGDSDTDDNIGDIEGIGGIEQDPTPRSTNADTPGYFINDYTQFLPTAKSAIGYYSYINQLNKVSTISKYEGSSFDIKTFKYKEWYRFGIQFQDKLGIWSEVVPIIDLHNDQQLTPYSSREGSLIKDIVSRAYFKYELSYTIANNAINEGYKKARLCCVYTNNSDRSVICQGVLNPTIRNQVWAATHTPDYMASWFFRANTVDPTPSSESQDYCDRRGILPWVHDKKLIGSVRNSAYLENQEIQSSYYEGGYTRTQETDSSFIVDRNVVTLNSPDIELDESIRTIDYRNLKLRIIGKIPIDTISTSTFIEASSPMSSYNGYKGEGNVLLDSNLPYSDAANTITGYTYCSYWSDMDVYRSHSVDGREDNFFPQSYPIYPFQRKGSLNNFMVAKSDWPIRVNRSFKSIDIKASAVLSSKCIASLKYSHAGIYQSDLVKTVSNLGLFDSNVETPLLLTPNNSSDVSSSSLIYYGNVNAIAPVNEIPASEQLRNSYYSMEVVRGDDDDSSRKFNVVGNYPIYKYETPGESRTIEGFSSDPVPITYKSTPHYVLQFESESILPDNYNQEEKAFLWLGELYRDNITNRFGGNTEEAYSANHWIPCGPAVKLTEDTTATLLGLEGDTYYQRYDCLKTYPYTREDTNQIVEILSFMCETRINLDGRWDKRRGWLDNTTTDNTNFNLVNTGYTQSNSTFIQSTIDSWLSKNKKFSNQFTWTRTKQYGEDVDTWTNITLASVADADGSVGDITKIINYNNNLYLFQENGIAAIGFNEKTALSTETGVPLEIANSGKYTGLQYLSKEVGCQNKWSINKSKAGLFFIDNSRYELLSLDSSLNSLSTISGFSSFMINNIKGFPKSWVPDDVVKEGKKSAFTTFYDEITKDVYYINNDTALAWNEDAKAFTSFYDYDHVLYLANIDNHSLVFKHGDNPGIYALREGEDYNMFFGKQKPYSITLVCDGITDEGNAFQTDKVFNNIEYRADAFNSFGGNTESDGSYSLKINSPVFSHKAAWNGYQLKYDRAINAVRKFNTWRVQLPRAVYKFENKKPVFTRDRVRNTFSYIQLINKCENENDKFRIILHDLAVTFDVK